MTVKELKELLDEVNDSAAVMIEWNNNKLVKSVTEIVETVRYINQPDKTTYKLILKS